jgi:cytoskeletal protein CcmA (bactofilin family)
MWRKSIEAKPQPAASKTPAPAPVNSPETQPAPQPASTPATAISAPATAAAPTQPAAPPSAQAKAAAWPQASAPVVASVPASGSAPPPAPSETGSTISAGLKIKGDITGTSDLTIDGETLGKILIANGRVTVGPNGRVTADIDAREIVVLGTVRGNLKATESIHLGASSQVEGSLLTPRMAIDDGARLRGNVEMTRPGETTQAQSSTEPKLESTPKAHAVHARASVTSTSTSAPATEE